MEADREIKAMSAVAAALDSVDEESRGRVLRWAADRYGTAAFEQPPAETARSGDDEVSEFADLSELYDAADPSTDQEKALVAGYWFQVVQDESDFEALPVNSGLKDLGHGIGNITRAFSGLMAAKPRLAMQVQKRGSTKQARKRYKLTTAGIRQVQEMLGAS